jgi:hypothetical protein
VAEWPWWVRFWEIHPGVSREQALRPLNHQFDGVFTFGFATLLAVGLSYMNQWRHNLVVVLPALLFLTMTVLMVWLRLAVRWVDRHAVWGGQYRPRDQEKPPRDEPEPAIPEG